MLSLFGAALSARIPRPKSYSAAIQPMSARQTTLKLSPSRSKSTSSLIMALEWSSDVHGHRRLTPGSPIGRSTGLQRDGFCETAPETLKMHKFSCRLLAFVIIFSRSRASSPAVRGIRAATRGGGSAQRDADPRGEERERQGGSIASVSLSQATAAEVPRCRLGAMGHVDRNVWCGCIYKIV